MVSGGEASAGVDDAAHDSRRPSTPSNELTRATVVDAFRDEWGRIISTLVRRTGDWDLAEECAQAAFERALLRWPRDGVPERPGAWLTTVARNLAMDHLRRIDREELAARRAAPRDVLGPFDQVPESPDDLWLDESGDDRLRLLFTCCHPALALESRVALTLRTLGGLTTAEIARAFLVSEGTMAKRLVRAKRKIENAAIPYRVPGRASLGRRSASVLSVIYLIFNEGYSASSGDDVIRRQLADRALELARLTAELLPEEPEARGLLALILFQRSRFEARVDENGDLVTLEEQDRSLWDRYDIAEALDVLDLARRSGGEGTYVLQATIASHHARADSLTRTDWGAIVASYERLLRLSRSPVVALNHAVAVAMHEGPAAGLALVADLEDAAALRDYYLLAATRADLLRRLGRLDEAATSYREALSRVGTEPERRFLRRRLSEVDAANAQQDRH